METTKKTVNKRKIVALILVVSFIMLPISAVCIHGGHGHSSGHIWLHLHVFFGVVFTVACIFHIVYNWRALKCYLFGKK